MIEICHLMGVPPREEKQPRRKTEKSPLPAAEAVGGG